MGAGSGLEPKVPENESGVLPLHYPAKESRNFYPALVEVATLSIIIGNPAFENSKQDNPAQHRTANNNDSSNKSEKIIKDNPKHKLNLL